MWWCRYDNPTAKKSHYQIVPNTGKAHTLRSFIRPILCGIADTKNDVIPQPLNIVSGTAVGPISWGVGKRDIRHCNQHRALCSRERAAAGHYGHCGKLRTILSVVSSQSFMARSKIMDGIIIELAQYKGWIHLSA